MMRYLPDKHVVVPKGVPDRNNVRELCTLVGAQRLAHELQDWWHKRGHTQVRVWVDETPFAGAVGTVYSIRTNLIRGMPPKEKARQLWIEDDA